MKNAAKMMFHGALAMGFVAGTAQAQTDLYSNDFSVDEADAVANGTPGSTGLDAGNMTFDRNGSSPLSASISGGNLNINSSSPVSGANNVAGYTPGITLSDYTSVRIVAEIDSITGTIGGNGQFVGFTNDNVDNYNSPSNEFYAGFYLQNASGDAAIRFKSASTTAENNITADYSSFTDGYTVDFTLFDDDTYAYTISGLANITQDVSGTATISGDLTSVSGTGSLPGGFYSAIDGGVADAHGALTAQALNGSGSATVSYSSINVTGVPEPGSLALLGLGGLALARRRRRS